MQDHNRLLALWRKTALKPGGKKLFSRLVCLDAPYFASIRPTIEVLEYGHVEVSMARRRAVTDHRGQIHNMAIGTLAALTGRLLAETSTPASHRWLATGISTDHDPPAAAAMAATAATATLTAFSNGPVPVPQQLPDAQTINIEVRNGRQTLICRAQLRIRLEPRRYDTPQQQAPAAHLHSRIFNA